MIRTAVINQKGGTGKTTTAVNLAAGLARAGHRTLLVDLDPQAHATIGVGLSPDDFPERTISEVLVAENPSFEGFIADTYLEHLKLVPASIRLSRVASQLHSQNFREHRLAQAFEGLDGFDYAIIDCQPTLEVLPVNAMVAADYFLIPTQPAGFGLRGLADLLFTRKGLRRQGPLATVRPWDWHVLMTMVMGQAKSSAAPMWCFS
jgi:chromosome partitioning protein